MRRGLSIAGLLLLIGVLALAGCTQKAPTRAVATGQAAATREGVPPSTGAATPAPGETVVTVFTPVSQTPVAGVTPTQDLGNATPVVATPIPSAPTTAPSGGTGNAPIVHVVQPGETLSSIAARYGTTVQAIAQANNIVDPNTIYVGQRLNISVSGGSTQPSGGCRIRHTVQQGDRIWQIARNYGVSPYAILAANGLTIETGSYILPGQVLCIP